MPEALIFNELPYLVLQLLGEGKTCDIEIILNIQNVKIKIKIDEFESILSPPLLPIPLLSSACMLVRSGDSP
jgi:hypothetical protein